MFLKFALTLVLCALAGDVALLPVRMKLAPGPLDDGQTFALWPHEAPGAQGKEESDRPSLTAFFPPPQSANGGAIIICPGGGYAGLSVGPEGADAARWLNKYGIAAFVLRYRVKPYHQPSALLDVQRAVRIVRCAASTWKIDPHRIGVMGFSAGGHVASTVGTHFDAGTPAAPDPAERVSCRPDFLVLLYPVITMMDPYTHISSRDNFLGPDPTDAEIEQFSNETQVTADTPPCFLAHAMNDDVVSFHNAVLFHDALVAHGVPTELALFESGGHGFALAENIPGARGLDRHVLEMDEKPAISGRSSRRPYYAALNCVD